MNFIVLIPAFNPDDKIIILVKELLTKFDGPIIIVNDGSDIECDIIFKDLKKLSEKVEIVTHAVNLGKGRALKTGLNYIVTNFNQLCGVITADADGQHKVDDIINVGNELIKNRNNLILGVRTFPKTIPLRSMLGNLITKKVFYFLTGLKVSDTQTGLRGIPLCFIKKILPLSGERYEYEMNVLIKTKEYNVNIFEVPIETIYIDGNKSSHFNALFDSMRIYFLLLRFGFSSITTSIVDFIVFSFLFLLTKNILVSIVIGRIVAGTYNYTFNKTVVFKSKNNSFIKFFQYWLLVIILGSIAYFSISFLNEKFNVGIIYAKIIIESLLFLSSFAIQRNFIFIKDRDVVYEEN